MPSPINYALTSDGSHVAYQTLGAGDLDLVFVPWFHTHLELHWEHPSAAMFLNRLARIGRLILFDKRGAGLSDPAPRAGFPTLEEWMDDVRAVMDAAGSRRAILFGHSGGCMMTLLFAATYPQRVSHLVLLEGYARLTRSPDYPHGAPPEWVNAYRDIIEHRWGTGASLAHAAPSLGGDSESMAWFGRYERNAASPGESLAMLKLTSSVDLRATLPVIRTPTLILHRRDNPVVRAEHGRFLADHLPNASLVELAGRDHAFFSGNVRPLLERVETFVAGAALADHGDRVLSTIMFTDIVDSTKLAASVGDNAWRDCLSGYNLTSERIVAQYGGSVVKGTGDGFLARFDGPARAIRCAGALRDVAHTLHLRLRIGVHAGEVMLGDGDVAGIGVHLASRVQSCADPDEILVSQTVHDLVLGSDLAFEDRGSHLLKGFSEPWHLYAVRSIG